MTFRACILALALGMFGVVGIPGEASAQFTLPPLPTYILVHGAFHGGWCWDRVVQTKLLPSRVFTPTLTGVGERSHLAGPDVTLQTHIDDVVNTILFEDLKNVVLVGHSYGGMVITGVAARIPERIGKLIYFDAVVPDSGQSFFSAIGYGAPIPPGTVAFPSFTPAQFGLTNPSDIAWVEPHLTTQPVGTFTQPLTFDWKALASIPKAFVHATGDWFAYVPFLTFRQKAIDMGFEYAEINTSHDAMVIDPLQTAALIAVLGWTAALPVATTSSASDLISGP